MSNEKCDARAWRISLLGLLQYVGSWCVAIAMIRMDARFAVFCGVMWPRVIGLSLVVSNIVFLAHFSVTGTSRRSLLIWTFGAVLTIMLIIMFGLTTERH